MATEKPCKLWSRTKPHSSGYAYIKIDGVNWRSNRYAWTQAYGPIPEGLHVLHRCDVELCVEPEHLFLGTNEDNVADKVAKGRQARTRGEEAGNAKLNWDKVRQIRALWKARAHTQVELARMFGVSRSGVQLILRGKTWEETASGI